MPPEEMPLGYPRRALPTEKRQIGSGVVGFCVARLAALHQSLRRPCGHHLPNGVPAEAQRSGFGGERRRKEVNEAFRPKGENGVHGLFDDAGGFGASELRWYGERLGMPRKHPSVAYGDSSPYRGAIQSSRRDTSTAPKGSDFTRPTGGFHLLTPRSKYPWGVEQISPPKGISRRAACRPLTRSK